MKRLFGKLSVMLVLIQLVIVFSMIAASGWGYKHAITDLEITPPVEIEFWHRWSALLLVVPVGWFIAVSIASAENRFRRTMLCLKISGILITSYFLYEAVNLLVAAIDIAGKHSMSL